MQLLIIASLSLTLSGCAVLFGHIKPIEEPAKKKSLTVPALAEPWKPVRSQEEGADWIYQDSITGSTLSFTSGCRSRGSPETDGERELERISAGLSGGLDQISRRRQAKALFDGVPALDSILEGKSRGRALVIRSLVSRKDGCVYDVTLVSLKRFFDAGSGTMDSWISGIRLP